MVMQNGFLTAKSASDPFTSHMNEINAGADIRIHPVASLEDLQAIWAFDEAAYGNDENITFDLFRRWWSACPSGFVAAYRHGTPIGIIGMFPVTADWYIQLIAREVTEADLGEDIIKRSTQRHWYFSGISIEKSSRGSRKLLAKLVCQALQHWCGAYREVLAHGPVSVVSVGTTEKGCGLLRDLLRFRLVNAGDAERKRHPIFAREVDEKQIRAFVTESDFCKGCSDPMPPWTAQERVLEP